MRATNFICTYITLIALHGRSHNNAKIIDLRSPKHMTATAELEESTESAADLITRLPHIMRKGNWQRAAALMQKWLVRVRDPAWMQPVGSTDSIEKRSK